jgi:hypothetical protein
VTAAAFESMLASFGESANYKAVLYDGRVFRAGGDETAVDPDDGSVLMGRTIIDCAAIATFEAAE